MWLQGDECTSRERFRRFGTVRIVQSAQFVVFHAYTVVFHDGSERGGYLFGSREVAGVHQYGIAHVVVASAGITLSAAVDAHFFVDRFGERHFYAFNAFIVPDDGTPIRAYLFSQCGGGLYPCPTIAPV